MSAIAIVSDRGCDMTSERRHGIDVVVVPLVVRFGEEVVLDDGSLDADAFWKRVEGGATFPQTSQPSAGLFDAAFAPLVAAGRHVLCLVISGRLSGTVNAAHAAAQRFPGRVTVFDTRSLSVGQAWFVLEAAAAAREGQSPGDIVRKLEGVRERSHLFIALETVEFLRRGGRAGRLMPAMDRVLRVLRIRPLLRLDDGDLKPLGVARSMAKALARIVDEVARLGPIEALAVAHTRRAAEAAALSRALAARVGLPADATAIVEAGPALASHAGPGAFAVAVLRRSA